tara:strand:- start:193 stop:402 length:210 start_codon:yes stop_codon:yes gene_type:complete
VESAIEIIEPVSQCQASQARQNQPEGSIWDVAEGPTDNAQGAEQPLVGGVANGGAAPSEALGLYVHSTT